MRYFCPKSSQPKKANPMTQGGIITKPKIPIFPHFSLITYQLIQHINCLLISSLRYYRTTYPKSTLAW